MQLARFTRKDSPLYHEESGIDFEAGAHYLKKTRDEAINIEQSVLFLGSAEPANYGSWIIRVLPKLAVARKLGLDKLPILCYAPRKWQIDLLAACGIDTEQIIQLAHWRAYNVREVFIPSSSNPEGFLDEYTREFYQEIVSRLGIRRQRSSAIFIARAAFAAERNFNNIRSFIDEALLIDKLRDQGFQVIHPEQLSIQEQIKTFAEAKIIVGASGSALFNCVFSEPGTAILDIETSKNWLHAHANLFSSCGHTYALAFGITDDGDANAVHKQWNIDVESLSKKVAAFTSNL